MRTALLGLPAALALAVLAAGCTSGPAEPPSSYAGEAATPPPDPASGVPEQGTCRQLRELTSGTTADDAPAVDCMAPHTAYTLAVGRLDAGVDAVDADLAARTCRQELVDALGVRAAELDGTLLEAVWSRPSEEDWEQGARWFRCDLVARDIETDRLLELPEGAPPYRPRLPDAVSRCIREVTGSQGRFVTCDRRHDYRWAGSVDAGVDRRPGRARARSLAERLCERFVEAGAFWFTWPTGAAWSAGDRRISCYRAERG